MKRLEKKKMTYRGRVTVCGKCYFCNTWKPLMELETLFLDKPDMTNRVFRCIKCTCKADPAFGQLKVNALGHVRHQPQRGQKGWTMNAEKTLFDKIEKLAIAECQKVFGYCGVARSGETAEKTIINTGDNKTLKIVIEIIPDA